MNSRLVSLKELYMIIFLDSKRNNLSKKKYEETRRLIKKLEIHISKEQKIQLKEEAKQQVLDKFSHLYCSRCNKIFKNEDFLDYHMAGLKHKDYWDIYFHKEEVQNRLQEKQLVHDREKGLLIKQKSIDKKKLMKQNNSIKNNNDIYCEVCNKSLKTKDSLDQHMASLKHKDDWDIYFNQEEVKNRLLKKHLVHDREKYVLIKRKTIDKKKLWKQSSPIKDIIEENDILNNIKKHQADKYQFQEDDELDPSFINEEEYQKTFTTLLCDKIKDKKDLVVFEHEQIDTQEKEDKSEIKVFLSQMYKGYCQVCGFTFRKPNGINSFERFNWNDKRVVKVKKSFVSTADSLCLCRNCSANIKWGAFYPTFIDTIKQIEDFKNKKYIDIREKIHKVVDKQIPEIFETLLEFDDIYALEIELDGKPRNIYFTNEHLLQFVTYLQKENEVEEEVKIKKRKKEIYTKNSWLNDEEIPIKLAKKFISYTGYWDHPKAGCYVNVDHSSRIENNFLHGWSIKFGANYFLVGKAIKRCRRTINNYIENNTTISFDKLKDDLSKNIRGAVATGNNYEYSGYYPLEDGYMKFGVQAIDVDKGIEFLIKEVGLKTL